MAQMINFIFCIFHHNKKPKALLDMLNLKKNYHGCLTNTMSLKTYSLVEETETESS
jgi:hypothetical protein